MKKNMAPIPSPISDSFSSHPVHPFFRLPVELQNHIFQYLRPEDLLRLARVSKAMRLLTIDNGVWEYFYKREISARVLNPGILLRDAIMRIWEQTAAQLLPDPLQKMPVTKKRAAYQAVLDEERLHSSQEREPNHTSLSVISRAVSAKRRCSKPVIIHLLTKGSQIDFGTATTSSSFDVALNAKQPVSTLKMLVKYGAVPDCSAVRSSLDIAIQAGCPDETIGYLLYTLDCPPTPFSLRLALEAKQPLSVIKMLQERGASIFPDSLNYAIACGCSHEIISYFIGLPLVQAEEGNPSSLDLAIQGKCSLQTIQLIWEKGIRLTSTPVGQNSRVFSTLDLALSSGAPVKVIDFLLAKRAQPTLAGNQPLSSFQQALIGKYALEDLQYLYRKGIVDSRDITSPPPNPFEIGRSFSIAIEEKLPEETLLWMVQIGTTPRLEAICEGSMVIYSTLDLALQEGYGIGLIQALFEKGSVLRAGTYALVAGPSLLSSMECAIKGACSQEVLDFIAEKTRTI